MGTDSIGDDAHFEVLLDGVKCQGYALCLAVAPDVFDIPDDSAVAVLLRTTFPESDRSRLEAAVRRCPVKAIALSKVS